jgi:hypothetical protein
MRHRLLAVVLLAFACAGQTTDSTDDRVYRVLFIGNSLTATNDLPHTVAALGVTVHDILTVEAVTRPNLAIIDHVNGASNAVDMIRQGRWDYVVLQQGPTSQQIGRDTLILATKLLNPDIRAAGAQTAELMVWPASSSLSTFDGVLQSCLEAAGAVDGLCLPAGQAWRAAWAVDPTLPLYGPDGFHPSELGTYLAALVVYEGITGHSATALPTQAYANGHTIDAPVNTIQLLQRVAHETVLSYRR